MEQPAAPAAPPAAPGRPPGARALRLVMLLHRWAESGWARSAVVAWGVANGAVVPGPSEALLIPLGLADPRRALPLAFWATVGAVAGALIAYFIGASFFAEVGQPVLHWLGVGPVQLRRLQRLFERRGWVVVVLGSLPFLSPKAVSISAGAFGVPLPQFALAIIAVRGARFALVGLLLRFAGAEIVQYVERRLGRPLFDAAPPPRAPGAGL